MRNFSCKNKDSSFLLLLIIFPAPSCLFMQLLKNLVFVEFPRFLSLASSKGFHSLLEVVWKNTACMKTPLILWLTAKATRYLLFAQQKNALSSKETVINFLTRSVRI